MDLFGHDALSLRRSFVGRAVIRRRVQAGVPVAGDAVTVATEASYPPFSQTEADGSLYRFRDRPGQRGLRTCGAGVHMGQAGLRWHDPRTVLRKSLTSRSPPCRSSRSVRQVVDFTIPYYSDNLPLSMGAERRRGCDVPDGLDGKKRRASMPARRRSSSCVSKFGDLIEIRGYENIDQIHADLLKPGASTMPSIRCCRPTSF